MAVTPAKLLAGSVLALALVGVVQTAQLFRQDLRFSNAETEVSFWGRGNYHPDETTVGRTTGSITALLVIHPSQPDYLALQGAAAVWLAYWAEDDKAQAHFSRQSVAAQYAALEARPAHQRSWKKLAEYVGRSGNNEELAALAQARLKMLNTRDNNVSANRQTP